jgi:hypothetical protein
MASSRSAPKDPADEFGDEQAVPQAQCLQVGLHGGVGLLPLIELVLA